MHSTRVRAFRPIARIGVVASSLALLAMLLLPNAAVAATTIGSTAGTIGCNGGLDLVQTSTSATSPSYVVTAAGEITSWSTLTGPALGQIGLQVWHLTIAPATYQLVGASPLVTPTTANTLSTFPLTTRIPVVAGDLLGLRLEGPATCLQPSTTGDTLGYFLNPTNPAALAVETMTPYNVLALLNVSATIGTVTPPPPPPPPPSGGCDATSDTSANQTCDSTGGTIEVTSDTSSDPTVDTTSNPPTDSSNDETGAKSASGFRD